MGKIFEINPTSESWNVYIMIFPTVLEFFTPMWLGQYFTYAPLASMDARDQVSNFKKSYPY